MWFGIIPKITTLINVLLLPVLTPFLSPKDYGVWGVLSSYTAIAVSLYSLGLQIHLTNSYFEFRDKFYLLWGRLLTVFLLTSFIFSFILGLVFFFIIPEVSLFQKFFIAFFATFPVLFNANSLLANHFYVVKGEPMQMVVRNLISSMFGIVILFILVYFLNLGYIGFIGSSAISSLISFFLFIPPLWIKEKIFPRLEMNFRRLKTNIMLALPVVPHSLGFVLISSSSRLIMEWYGVEIEEIGIFSNGYMIGDYITIITSAVVTSIVPKVQELYRSNNLTGFRKYFYFSQGFAIGSVVLFSIWMPEIYKILIRNDELQIAHSIAQKICFANIVLPFYFFISTTTFIEKKSNQLLWLVFVPGIINVILCFIFIPYFGYESVVYTTILSYWSQLFIPFLVSYYKNTVSLWLGDLSKIFLILFIFILTLFGSIYLSSFDVFWKVIASLLIIFLFKFVVEKFRLFN